MTPNRSRLLTVSATVLCQLSLTSCLILPQKRQVLAVNPLSAQPPALEAWHQKSTVRFLLVHGMNNHPFGEHKQGPKKGQPNLVGDETYTALVERLKTISPKALGPYAEAATHQFQDFISSYTAKNHLMEEGGTITAKDFHIIKKNGEVLGYTFRRSFKPTAGRAGHPVEFYVASWALGACVAKEKAYGSHDGQTIPGDAPDHLPAIDARRHKLNRGLKHSVVNWGLTDAALYRGAPGKDYEWAVMAAMNKLVGDLDKDGRDQTVIVTASLGSTITYNALQTLMSKKTNKDWTDEDKRKLNNLFSSQDRDTSSKVAFYMFANQYGLLTAGPAADSDLVPLAENPAETLSAVVQEAPGTDRVVPLVAFSDPDDLLTYHLPPGGKSVTVTNVYVQNNGMKLLTPFGGLTNPLAAHNTYGRNPSVLNFMSKGR